MQRKGNSFTMEICLTYLAPETLVSWL